MTRTALPWFETLTDSTFALGAAARETHTAHQAAQAATAQYNLDRIRLLDGEITLTGRHAPHRPHDRAVMGIGKALQECRDRMASLYTEAALSYAYGTAWAIQHVLDSQEPPRGELARTPEGHLILPTGLAPVPPQFDGLERWCDHDRFEQARRRWETCDYALAYADELADQDYLADHQAYGDAHGLTDAAYAYGVLAESALHYSLLGAHARHTHP
ncbi:hypothetical protein ACFC8F_37305 [Streptomyces hydrogenans]|uniref:hypothetical protein n=1 Tax=Streptomyces hydrogenans TaxID=1873719 RepID=UPI0035E15351